MKMAYDEVLAERVRQAVKKRSKAVEKKMFGGLCFMVKGHMACGVESERIVVRVGADAYEKALARPGAKPMDFTGRALKGFVYVGSSSVKNGRSLQKWIDMAVAHADSLPPKPARKKLAKSKASAKSKKVTTRKASAKKKPLRKKPASKSRTTARTAQRKTAKRQRRAVR